MCKNVVSDLKRGTVKKENRSGKTGYHILNKERKEIAFGAGNPLKYGFEFKVYEDVSLENELFKISQENVIGGKQDFKIINEPDEKEIGRIERRKKSSFSKDLWEIFNHNDDKICEIIENSKWKAIIREYVIGTLPRKYKIYTHGKKLGTITENFSINTSVFNFKIKDGSKLDSRFLLGVIFCVDNL